MKKYSKPHFPLKKVIFIFVAGRPLPFERDLGPRNSGFAVFSENKGFFEKTAKKIGCLCQDTDG